MFFPDNAYNLILVPIVRCYAPPINSTHHHADYPLFKMQFAPSINHKIRLGTCITRYFYWKVTVVRATCCRYTASKKYRDKTWRISRTRDVNLAGSENQQAEKNDRKSCAGGGEPGTKICHSGQKTALQNGLRVSVDTVQNLLRRHPQMK